MPPSQSTEQPPPTPSKTRMVFEVVDGLDITNEQLTECAALFSDNYGVWAPDAPPPLKPGARIRMSASKLRNACWGDLENSVVVLCSVQGVHVGQAFATKWRYKNGYVGWVTQLVVDSNHRRCYIATNMLQMLRRHSWFQDVTMMGIASSHPASCNALCKLFNGNTRDVDLQFIARHAAAVLACAPVAFLKNAPVHGILRGDPGGPCSAFTSFFVDHTEPLQVLRSYLVRDKWAFGDLLDGHEFLVILPVPGLSES